MAEAIGLVGSAVSIATLAAQIASSVVKLKSYLDQIKDAREDINVLVEEIEDVHFILSDIEGDQRHNPYSAELLDNHTVSRCLDRCKRGVERLQRVVDEMAVEFESVNPMKRRWKAAKIIWKRDRVEKYRAELAGALRLMTLSHQIYMRSLIQLQPDIIFSRITRLLQTQSAQEVPIHSPISLSAAQVQGSSSFMRIDRTFKSCRSKRIQTAWLRWKFCSLLVGRAWDMELYRSQQGWDFSMSVYACVSFDSLVARYTYNGNVEGLRQLFSRGEASPFTVCLHIYPTFIVRKTLLDIGADKGNLKLCEFLINEGANPKYFADDNSMAPIDWFLVNAMRNDSHHSDSSNYSSCQLAGLLGTRSEMAVQNLYHYRGPVSVFSALLKQLDTPIGELTIQQRRDLAIQLVREPRFNSPDLFLTALNCNRITRAAIADEGGVGGRKTLLHAAAGAVGRLGYNLLFASSEQSKSPSISDWKSIILDLLDAGADLHAAYSRGYSCSFECAEMNGQITPLRFMFASIFSSCPGWYSSGYLCNAMSIWISILYDYGVDLEEYGLRESSTWVTLESTDCEAEYTGFSTRGTRDYHSSYYSGQKRMLGFNYGPFLEDWRVLENEHTDEFAGDFWVMVGRRVEVMPGSWTE